MSSRLDVFAALAQHVDARFESEQVPLLAALVNRPSHTYAKAEVEAAFGPLDRAFSELGFSTRQVSDPQGRFADHRVYESAAINPGDRCPALVGHMDTVFPRALGFLEMTRDGDTVFGPGVLDMKSGLTEMVMALLAVRDVDPDAFARMKLRVVCVSDEEVGSPSSNALYAELASTVNAALVFEAGRTEDKIVVERKGSAVFHVIAHGRSAHAGNRHEEGVNAIHALALVIPRLEGLTDYARGLTVNVGLVEGGTAKNTVPDLARCTLDARFLTAKDGEALIEALEGIVARPFDGEVRPARLQEVTFELEGGISRPPMEPSTGNHALRALYEGHAAKAGLGIGAAPLQGGGSDANLLAFYGVPCIDGLGPWGQHFHKVEERSSLDSLRRRTQALASLLLDEGLWKL